MRRTLSALVLSLSLLSASAPAGRAYTYQHTAAGVQVRWFTTTIPVALSNSLNSPPPNIKAGSDVVGAAQRALRRWSDATNINFSISFQNVDAVAQDGVNLITVSAVNAGFVGGGERPGRARVIFNPANGAISEADMAINPNLPFSTDGTHDTYDLESTFVHEIGHMLGLDHSAVVAASMQPRQTRNFVFSATQGILQTTVRTLSDDDLAGIRSIYGRRDGHATGSIAGTVNYGAGVHVWAENLFTGRVAGSAVTRSDGSYHIDQLPPTTYRVMIEPLNEPVFANEITAAQGPYTGIGAGPPFQSQQAQTQVAEGQTAVVNFGVGGVPAVNPRRHGLNGVIHAGPMPLVPGTTYRYYVAGEGVDQIPAANFSMTTPFLSIDPASHAVETDLRNALGLPWPVVSFNLRVADNAKVGEYSLRVQTSAGEVAFLAGALAVDPYTNRVELNPIDAHDFFVRQQYLDFLSREPDEAGFNAWLGVLQRCPNAFNTNPRDPSAECDRPLVSSGFFRSPEFDKKGLFVYRFYKAGFGRQPRYPEMIADMLAVTGSTAQEVFQRRAAFTNNFAARAEFQALYGGMDNATYVNTLMNRYGLQSVRTPNPSTPDNEDSKVTLTRTDLINALNAGSLTRAQVLRAVADSDEVSGAEFRPGFVTMQYIGYLKRDPDEGGFNAWLNYLNTNPSDFYTMVNGFVNSQEYRTRFGQP
jgi:Matrixin/Domain of unknown function (DUF4214)